MSPRVKLILFLCLVFISHVALPHFNDGVDFFVFTKWNMFANTGMPHTYDIEMISNRPEYLFRDHRERAQSFGFDTRLLYYLTVHKSTEELRQYLGKLPPKLMSTFCNCSALYKVKLDGPVYNHIVQKQPLETLTREQL